MKSPLHMCYCYFYTQQHMTDSLLKKLKCNYFFTKNICWFIDNNFFGMFILLVGVRKRHDGYYIFVQNHLFKIICKIQKLYYYLIRKKTYKNHPFSFCSNQKYPRLVCKLLQFVQEMSIKDRTMVIHFVLFISVQWMCIYISDTNQTLVKLQQKYIDRPVLSENLEIIDK